MTPSTSAFVVFVFLLCLLEISTAASDSHLIMARGKILKNLQMPPATEVIHDISKHLEFYVIDTIKHSLTDKRASLYLVQVRKRRFSGCSLDEDSETTICVMKAVK
jgi:hypothetical protein